MVDLIQQIAMITNFTCGILLIAFSVFFGGEY